MATLPSTTAGLFTTIKANPIISTLVILTAVLAVLSVAIAVYFGVQYGNASSRLQSIKTSASSINVVPARIYYKNVQNTNVAMQGAIKGYQQGSRILFIGDNMMTGGTASLVAYDAKATSLARQFTRLSSTVQNRLTASENFFGYESTVLDNRVVLSNNAWSADTNSLCGIGGHFLVTSSNTATITFKPSAICYSAQTQVFALRTSASFTLKVGDNAPVTITPSSLTPVAGNIVMQSLYFNNSASVPPVITITSTGASNATPVQLYGFSCNPYAALEIVNCGADLATTQIVNATTSTALLGPGLLALSPSLVVIDIGNTDFENNTPQATYVQNMQNLFTFLKSKSIPFFVLTPPWQQDVAMSTQSAYVAALKAVMDASSIPYLDFQGEMIDFQTQQSLGYSSSQPGGQMTFLSTLKAAQDILVALTGNAPQ